MIRGDRDLVFLLKHISTVEILNKRARDLCHAHDNNTATITASNNQPVFILLLHD